MAQKTLVTFIEKSQSNDCLKDIISLSDKRNYHLNIVVLGIARPMPFYAFGYPTYGGVVIPEDRESQIHKSTKEISDKIQSIEFLVQEAGISANVIGIYVEKGSVDDEIAEIAKVSDYAVLLPKSSSTADIYTNILSGVLFQSPIPIILNYTNLFSVFKPKRVFIAWNGGLEVSRAVHNALALVENAEEVIIGLFDTVMNKHLDGEDPGVDISWWLSRRGCNITLNQYTSGGKEIGISIREKALEAGCDLIVMGAYGHSRMRERIFGGTTQYMIDQNKIPILLAH